MCRPTSLSCTTSQRRRLEIPMHYHQAAEQEEERRLRQLREQQQEHEENAGLPEISQQHQQIQMRFPAASSQVLRDERLKHLTDYQRFLVFMKIMFKIIEQTEERDSPPKTVPLSTGTSRATSSSATTNTCTLIQRSKRIVDECTRRGKLGDENYLPLQDSVTVRLRCIIPEIYWNLTRDYLGYSCD